MPGSTRPVSGGRCFPVILRIEVEVMKLRGSVGKSSCTAYVGDEVAAEAQLMFAIQK